VTANTSTSTRTGTLTIGNRTVTVNQAAASSAVPIAPSGVRVVTGN
jgi:hypothetical protein